MRLYYLGRAILAYPRHHQLLHPTNPIYPLLLSTLILQLLHHLPHTPTLITLLLLRPLLVAQLHAQLRRANGPVFGFVVATGQFRRLRPSRPAGAFVVL